MYTLISPGDHLRITCNQTDWTRSINNVINIPRTIMHPAPPPTPPRPVAEHDTTWSSAAEHQQRDQHSTKDNTPHPTPPPTPPCPVAEHDTTGSSAAGQQPVCGHRRTWVPEGIYIYSKFRPQVAASLSQGYFLDNDDKSMDGMEQPMKKNTSLRMIPTMAYIATYSTALESKYAIWPKDTKEQHHFFSTSPSISHI